MFKEILNEIQDQPEHIRRIFMWLFVVITFSIVGFAWAHSTQRKLVALINPEEVSQDNALAKDNSQSPAATIFNSIKDLKAGLFDVFALSPSVNIQNGRIVHFDEVGPQELPLSADK